MFSLMSEEYFAEIMNASISKGMTPQSDDWPIAGVQSWGADSSASTLSVGQGLSIRAIVLLRVTIAGLKGERHQTIVRMRIARKGTTGAWRGLILGAPVLDVPPLGLGHEPRLGGHYFKALGFMTARLEGTTVQKGLEGLLVAACRAGVGNIAAHASVAEVKVSHPAAGLPLFMMDSKGQADPVATDMTSGSLIAAISNDTAPVHLEADQLNLALGESAWVPASTPLQSRPAGSLIEIETNIASTVHAVAGLWDSSDGMLLVANWSQPDVCLVKGDVVGVARGGGVQEPADLADGCPFAQPHYTPGVAQAGCSDPAALAETEFVSA